MKAHIKKNNYIFFIVLAVTLNGCWDDSYNCQDKEIAKQALDINFQQSYGKYSKEFDKVVDDYKTILEVSDVLLFNIDDKAKTSTCEATFKINLKDDKNKKIYSKFLSFGAGRAKDKYFLKDVLKEMKNINEDSFKLKYGVYDNNRGDSIIEVYR